MRLKDKVAIITGGANGIGHATAKRFAAEGAKVVIADLRREQSDAAVKDTGAAWGEIVDVTQRASVDALVAGVKDRFGRIDVLVNNAGITKDARLV